MLLLVHFDRIQIVHSDAVQRRKLRGQRAASIRMLKQPPRTFELNCRLELSSGKLTEHEFAQFISTYCRENTPGPACTTYSFRELPLAIKLPFVSNVCPDDPANEIICLHDLITSGDIIPFTGDVGELCLITYTMMKDNYFFGDDLPRLKHYYGNEAPPPDSIIQSEGADSPEQAPPKYKSAVYTPDEMEDDKSVKEKPTKHPAAYKSVVYTPDEVKDDKSVKEKPSKHPATYRDVVLSQEYLDESEVAAEGMKSNLKPKGSSKVPAVAADGAPSILISTVPSTTPPAQDKDLPENNIVANDGLEEAGTGDSPGDAKSSAKSKKASKVPAVSTDSSPSLILATAPSSQPQLQEEETESPEEFEEAATPAYDSGEFMKPNSKGKKSFKHSSSMAPAPTAVPSTTPSFALQKEEEEEEEGNEETYDVVSPSPTALTPLPVHAPSEELATDFAEDLRRDVDLDIDLGPYAQLNEDAPEEETVKSSDSSIPGLATGAAVVAIFGALTATKINKGRKRRREEYLLSNDPALFEDASVASERSHTHGYDGSTSEFQPWSQLKTSAHLIRSVAPEASVLLKTVSEVFRSADTQQSIKNPAQGLDDDVEAPSHKCTISQFPAPCQMNEYDTTYLEDTTASSHHGSSNDDDIVTLSSEEAQKRDVLASNGARETIVEVLAAAEDQKSLLADFNDKSYFLGESTLNEKVSSLAPSEADPMEAYDEVETSSRDRIKPFVEKYLRPKLKETAETEEASAAVPLANFKLPPREEDNNLDSISRSSSFSFTKGEKRDLEDISQEIENDDKRPWRRVMSSSIEFGRSRSCSRSRSHTEENLVDLGQVASMLKSLPNDSQSIDSALTDEASSVDGGSFLSEDVLKQFKAVDQRLSEGFKEFMDTEQECDDLSTSTGPPIGITEKPVVGSDNFDEYSYASSCPVIGDVVEDFEGFEGAEVIEECNRGTCDGAAECKSASSSHSKSSEGIDSDEESSSSDESAAEEHMKQVDDIGSQESEEDSSSDESSSSSDESSAECKKNKSGGDGSRSHKLGSVEEHSDGDSSDDGDDDGKEVADFSTLRSHFAATWYHPGQQKAPTELRPNTPPRLDGQDFVGKQPASLLAPAVSSDEEEN